MEEKKRPALLDALAGTDPEFTEFFGRFAFDEVVNQPGQELEEETRYLAILAALLGCQGLDAFRCTLGDALEAGVAPVKIREVVYQATAYLGIGRTFAFLEAFNDTLKERGVALPLEEQSTTTPENRREKGTEVQVAAFGEGMRDAWRGGREETRHINFWLAANCFGDYYTRGGLDLKEREMVTLCFLAAQGGCEPQLTSHAGANMRVGNDRLFLIRVVSQCMPYLGYPRTLNAVRCINEAAKKQNA